MVAIVTCKACWKHVGGSERMKNLFQGIGFLLNFRNILKVFNFRDSWQRRNSIHFSGLEPN